MNSIIHRLVSNLTCLLRNIEKNHVGTNFPLARKSRKCYKTLDVVYNFHYFSKNSNLFTFFVISWSLSNTILVFLLHAIRLTLDLTGWQVLFTTKSWIIFQVYTGWCFPFNSKNVNETRQRHRKCSTIFFFSYSLRSSRFVRLNFRETSDLVGWCDFASLNFDI